MVNKNIGKQKICCLQIHKEYFAFLMIQPLFNSSSKIVHRIKILLKILIVINTAMDSSTQTSDGDLKLNSDLFNLAEKLRIELQKKDEELLKKEQKYSDHLDVELTRINQITKLVEVLDNSLQKNHVLQMSLWKSFPFPDLSYYIKTQSGLQNRQFRNLYADRGYKYLRASAGDRPQSEFKCNKNSDGSFSIYAMGRSLKTDANSSRVGFAGTGNDGSAEKFVLFFHQQNQAGLLVDISSMVGSFLCVDNDGYVMANSCTAPTDKFLIVPVGVE